MAKIVLGVVIALIVLPGALYGLAYLTTSRSGLSRSIIWMDADAFDYKRFPARSMAASDDPLVLNRASPDDSLFDAAVPGGDVERFFAQSQTAAFIAIRDDEVIYEDYFNGFDEDSTVTSFSVAKSYIATLIGIALESGFIDSLDDPVTRYIPELSERDQRFGQITLRHLLTMSSGLRWNEQGLPWSDDAETYYGTDLRRLAMQDTEIAAPPGESFVYNPYNTLLLGLVLERATEQQVSEFMEDELWRPMGAVADGTWSLDSDTNGFEKMESGLNSRAIDMVKLGLVYLHGGALNGNRIITTRWAREATAFTNENDPSTEYQYQWWTYADPELGDWFGAQGNKGQFIAVFPSRDLVLARFGIDFGYDNWPALLATMARTLPRR
ncbi:MAG: beta-lactamase family protein [Actinomycetota bacterium]|nr:beta-lactamase family protein [Actinomycetota bacterium]